MEKKANNKKRKFEQISSSAEEEKLVPQVATANESKRLRKNESDTIKEELKSNSKNKMKRIILWFRNDLRMHDNAILDFAAKHSSKNKEILPVYCFDPRFFTRKVLKYDTMKCGLIRTRFILETVENLRKNLESIDSKLLVSMEKPEVFLSRLVQEGQDTSLVYQEEICSEELEVEKLIYDALKGVDIQKVWNSTLYHRDDLPFKPADLPHIYGKFREKSESTKVRELIPTPKKNELPFTQELTKVIKEATAYLPKLEEFSFKKEEIETPRDQRACYNFIGGEDEGIKRCKEYIWSTKSVGNYAVTRNELIGANYSSKLSPWLANGSISPRYIYWEVKEFEKKHRKNESTQVFIDELFWRDFNRFWSIKYGNKIFSSYGIYNREYYNWTTKNDIVKRWKEGNTGLPIIDALMREMNCTGFMPNRGRMVVACYFAMDLKQDWRYGAHYFEEKLIDHDVQSNYGGWCFSAGIGPGRVLVFNSVKQSKDHDKYGEYIKLWVPELKKVPVEYIHEPWKMPADLQKACKTYIGQDYPKPIECDKYTSGLSKSQLKERSNKKKEQKKVV